MTGLSVIAVGVFPVVSLSCYMFCIKD